MLFELVGFYFIYRVGKWRYKSFEKLFGENLTPEQIQLYEDYKNKIKTLKIKNKIEKINKKLKVDGNVYSLDLLKNENPKETNPENFKENQAPIFFKNKEELEQYIKEHIKENDNEIKSIIDEGGNFVNELEGFITNKNIEDKDIKKEEIWQKYVKSKSNLDEPIYEEELQKQLLKNKLYYGFDENIKKNIKYNKKYISEIDKKTKNFEKITKTKIKPRDLYLTNGQKNIISKNKIAESDYLQQSVNFKIQKLNFLERVNGYSATKYEQEFLEQRQTPSILNLKPIEFEFNDNKKTQAKKNFLNHKKDKDILELVNKIVYNNWDKLKDQDFTNLKEVVPKYPFSINDKNQNKDIEDFNFNQFEHKTLSTIDVKNKVKTKELRK